MYLNDVLEVYTPDAQRMAKVRAAAAKLVLMLSSFVAPYRLSISYSGSISKGTSVITGTDLDLFISLSSQTPFTLQQIYLGLVSYLRTRGYHARPQNVSVGLTFDNLKVDLTPGRRHSQHGDDHSLYLSKRGTWTQTNITKHRAHVVGSGRVDEIRLAKIWRHVHAIEFPSFALELAVIEALHGALTGVIEQNFVRVLEYFADELERARLVDPANQGNIVSDDMTAAELKDIATHARRSLGSSRWDQVVW